MPDSEERQIWSDEKMNKGSAEQKGECSAVCVLAVKECKGQGDGDADCVLHVGT